jgi:hypothetical protein
MRLYMSRIAVKTVFDKIQSELRCCGNKRYDDWFDVGGPLCVIGLKFKFFPDTRSFHSFNNTQFSY